MRVILKNHEFIVKNCQNFKDRLIGLMFKKEPIDYCLRFPKCNSIHTFFMRQNIDVVMTDKSNKILYIYKSLKPWKVILPKKNVYFTYEFKENIINLKINDNIIIKE